MKKILTLLIIMLSLFSMNNLAASEEVDTRNIIKSSSSTIESKVQFRNLTRSTVSIYWIDQEGNEVLFSKLKPQHKVTQSTFFGHVWRFRVELTGEPLGYDMVVSRLAGTYVIR